MSRERGNLTPKQERFVQEYLMNVNAARAALRAGYSKKTAQEQSSRLLSNVMVSEAIAKGQQALAEKTGVTAEKVIAEIERKGEPILLRQLKRLRSQLMNVSSPSVLPLSLSPLPRGNRMWIGPQAPLVLSCFLL